ncbi:MAG: TlpA disulfide reductase family protein [Gammaproteobacteria bacterium]|nr:TlpA disulfide reductase family protein [Gammaproteobacteria bacterium]MDE0281995.1 TlpA disulfide reductase family protein [Gammaproteobacteria bacterium]MDE0714062.1 TlpA disulfide reductase family protein [Gammaproteobacteria bacterium]MXX16972.1 TlpA family protein disulfide reductase [Gammaproteobacteria bacterium]MXY64019.1 TlpA family protein disulfide reductase [Gammaproteobacteria bacterium]
MRIRSLTRHVTASAAGLLLAVLLTVPGSAAELRRAAQPFTLEALTGSNVSLADYGDHVLLVNFWATWCPPCVAELSTMQALKDTLAGEPFEILALNVGEEPRQVRDFLRQFRTDLEFPILLRAERGVARAWNVNAMPTSALIDKKGRLAATMVGPRDWNSSDSLRLVRILLEE